MSLGGTVDLAVYAPDLLPSSAYSTLLWAAPSNDPDPAVYLEIELAVITDGGFSAYS
ncbi:hypothetical protein RCH12_002790 [Cryobacterium sp. MP_3.1]|uniref:hypothetical protein n=1 Tax=Cryobacterium sp. MP_3.1 TaxID=3071711 RepID=UPI002E09C4DE|nr:hypothetical protein [Cryobacterium sp. MP_3.1]